MGVFSFTSLSFLFFCCVYNTFDILLYIRQVSGREHMSASALFYKVMEMIFLFKQLIKCKIIKL